MLRIVPPPRAKFPPPASPQASPTHTALLLDFAAPIAGAHALIVGRHAIELMCAMLHAQCAEAALIDPAGKPEPAQADLIIFPDLAGGDQPDRICHFARRALVPTGRAVMRLSDDHSGAAALPLARALRAAGFVAPRIAVLGDETLLRVELPAFHMAASA